MAYKRKVINDYPNHYGKVYFKDNCNLESRYSLILEDADIYQAECIKVINEKIIDQELELFLVETYHIELKKKESLK